MVSQTALVGGQLGSRQSTCRYVTQVLTYFITTLEIKTVIIAFPDMQ